jgi:hypothetical protein
MGQSARTVADPVASCTLKQKEVLAAGLRFREPTRGGCLHGTAGYLQLAQYSKFGDTARYFTIEYKDGWTAADVKVGGLGLPGTIHWPSAASYWTEPRPNLVVRYDGWDTDKDGLTDGWEVEYGLNPKTDMASFDLAEDEDEDDSGTLLGIVDSAVTINPGGGLGDPDADGLLNVQEYYGQDGYRIDFITGSGDETIPWVARAMNYPNQSSFETYVLANWILLRHDMQAPMYDEVMFPGLEGSYSMSNYPGFFPPGRVCQPGDPMGDGGRSARHERSSGFFYNQYGYAEPGSHRWRTELSILRERHGDAGPVLRRGLRGHAGRRRVPAVCHLLERPFYLDVNGDGRYTPGSTICGIL